MAGMTELRDLYVSPSKAPRKMDLLGQSKDLLVVVSFPWIFSWIMI